MTTWSNGRTSGFRPGSAGSIPVVVVKKKKEKKMKIKLILIMLILFGLISIGYSGVSVPIKFITVDNPNGDSLWIQIQVAKDSTFEVVDWDSDWILCQPNDTIEVFADLSTEGEYSMRGRHKNEHGLHGVWNPPIDQRWSWHLIINKPPGGCFPFLPACGDTIKINNQ